MKLENFTERCTRLRLASGVLYTQALPPLPPPAALSSSLRYNRVRMRQRATHTHSLAHTRVVGLLTCASGT